MTATSNTGSVPAPSLDCDASYDEWLNAEIDEAISDPRPSIPSDEVERHFAAKRAALKKRIQGS